MVQRARSDGRKMALTLWPLLRGSEDGGNILALVCCSSWGPGYLKLPPPQSEEGDSCTRGRMVSFHNSDLGSWGVM